MFPFNLFSLENNKETNIIIKTTEEKEKEKKIADDLDLCELKSMFMIKLQEFLYKSHYSLTFFYKILKILKNKYNDTNFHNFIDNVLILHIKHIYSEGLYFVIQAISTDLEKYNNKKYLSLLYSYINTDNSKFNSKDYLQQFIDSNEDEDKDNNDIDFNEINYENVITEEEEIEHNRLENFYNTCG